MMNARRVDRLLHIHAVIDDIADNLAREESGAAERLFLRRCTRFPSYTHQGRVLP
jgi:hypothetical protein